MGNDGEWKMKSIDSYLLRERKEIIAYFAGKPVYAGDDYRDEFWSMPQALLRKLSNEPDFLAISANAARRGSMSYSDAEWSRLNMLNTNPRVMIAASECDNVESEPKSLIRAILSALRGVNMFTAKLALSLTFQAIRFVVMLALSLLLCCVGVAIVVGVICFIMAFPLPAAVMIFAIAVLKQKR